MAILYNPSTYVLRCFEVAIEQNSLRGCSHVHFGQPFHVCFAFPQVEKGGGSKSAKVSFGRVLVGGTLYISKVVRPPPVNGDDHVLASANLRTLPPSRYRHLVPHCAKYAHISAHGSAPHVFCKQLNAHKYSTAYRHKASTTQYVLRYVHRLSAA